MGVNAGAEAEAGRETKHVLYCRASLVKPQEETVSRGLERDPHQGNTWLYPSPSLTHSTHHSSSTLQVLPPVMGGWKDPASPCRHLPCTAVGSSAQSPRIPSIMLEGAAGASTAVSGQSFLQTQGTVGLLILQPPTPPPLPLPRLCGGDGCCGGEDGCGEKQGETGRSREPGSYLPLFSHLLFSP